MKLLRNKIMASIIIVVLIGLQTQSSPLIQEVFKGLINSVIQPLQLSLPTVVETEAPGSQWSFGALAIKEHDTFKHLDKRYNKYSGYKITELESHVAISYCGAYLCLKLRASPR